VRLRSVRPLVDARGKVDVHLDGTAKAYADFVALEESLMESASFSRVYPGSERVESAAYRAGAPPLPGPAAYAGATAAGEIAFSLSFEYFPGGRPKAEDAGGAGK